MIRCGARSDWLCPDRGEAVPADAVQRRFLALATSLALVAVALALASPSGAAPKPDPAPVKKPQTTHVQTNPTPTRSHTRTQSSTSRRSTTQTSSTPRGTTPTRPATHKTRPGKKPTAPARSRQPKQDAVPIIPVTTVSQGTHSGLVDAFTAMLLAVSVLLLALAALEPRFVHSPSLRTTLADHRANLAMAGVALLVSVVIAYLVVHGTSI